MTEARTHRRWTDPVIIALMVAAVGAAITTWATAEDTKRQTVRIGNKLDDHEQRIRASEMAIVQIGSDVSWIRQYLEKGKSD